MSKGVAKMFNWKDVLCAICIWALLALAAYLLNAGILDAFS